MKPQPKLLKNSTQPAIVFLVLVLASFALLNTFIEKFSKPLATIQNAISKHSGTVAQATGANQIFQAYGKLPLRFEANQGQVASSAEFISHGHRFTTLLNSDGAVLSLERAKNVSKVPKEGTLSYQASKALTLRMKLLGAKLSSDPEGLGELSTKSNYLIGSDPQKWRTNIPNYSQVEYREIYPGIDLLYYGNQSQLEYDFTVAPGRNPEIIKLTFEGAEKTAIDAQGNLVLHVGDVELKQEKPFAYQELSGARQQISCAYVINGDQVSFKVGAYDPAKELVIDPVLVYSTYLGGSDFDYGTGIAIDTAGNAYVTGMTESIDFPTANAQQPTYGGGNLDVFVAKLNPDGSALLYSTYLGGSGTEYDGGIAVDSAGNAYITGTTESTDFPTMDAIQPSHGGSTRDAFVTKLDSTGAVMIYSTYLGGHGDDLASMNGNGIAVDAAGNAYVTGLTASTNFPTANALQPFIGGFPFADAYITKIDPAGSSLVYSTYLGGSETEIGYGIVIDGGGNVYVCGETRSSDFPTVNASQPSFGGGEGDAFIAKIDSTGSALVYASYLGGSSGEFARSVAIDASGNAYLTGQTSSDDFPMMNPLQAVFADGLNAFVTKLNPSGSALVYSTYLSGSLGANGIDIAVDSAGCAYLIGNTGSADFPVVDALQPTYGGNTDAFVAKLNAAGSALLYSTYLGGSNGDGGTGIALDSYGDAYVAGSTFSTNFPTANPLQPASNGAYDAFIARITKINTPAGSNVTVQPVDATTQTSPITLSFSTVNQAGITSLTTSGTGPAPPAGFQLGNPATYYDLSTTANVSGSINLCVNYSSVSYPDESQLTLWHFEGGVWSNVTASLDILNNLICGNVTSLSPFAIFAPANSEPRLFYLHATGPNSNPPVLFLNNIASIATTTKFKDSTTVKLSGGNLWKEIGTWPAGSTLTTGTLTALDDLHVWLGLKNSDDQGSRFDLRAEVYKNGLLVAAGESYCIQGVTRNPSLAKEVTVTFASLSPAVFDGNTDTLSLKILTRIGTNGAGSFCGGHTNAAGLRLYFDAVSQSARFSATF